MSTIPRFAPVFVLALALSAPAHGEGVVVVGGPSVVQYPDIQSAIDAAADGDVLLVADGTYAGFTISNKSLSVFAQPGATVLLTDTVQVDHLAASGRIVLSGLTMGLNLLQSPVLWDNLLVIGCAGQVRVENCALYGMRMQPGANGVDVSDSPHVVLAQCALRGGAGFYDDTPFAHGGNGGAAVYATNSGLALYDCQIVGGDGGWADVAGDGGPGIRVGAGATALATYCTITGGVGGHTLGLGQDGDGGPGARIEGYGTLWTFDCVVRGGASPGGSAGPPFSNSGGVGQYPGIARTLASLGLIADSAGTAPFVVTGLPGDRVFLMSSLGIGWSLDLSFPGYWLVPLPAKMSTVPLGTIGPSGVLNFTVPIASLGGAASHQLFTRQCFVIDSQGKRWLTGPVEQLVYAHHGAPDCDGDGIVDYAACLDGLVPDCNHSLIPDACELASGAVSDCNLNGVPDDCDIASGASSDGNANGVPDDCEFPVPVYVDDSAPPGGNGSQGAPFQFIQDGVDSAAPGMTVLVRDGTYTGVRNRGIDFHGKNIVVRSENGPANCIIDCQQLGRAFYLHTHETSTARIEGFTITNGRPIPNAGGLVGHGGAIALDRASATLAHCMFQANHADATGNGGGAVYAYRSNLTIQECFFTSNIARLGQGGAVELSGWNADDTTLTLRGCTFTGNKSLAGGAVWVGAMSVVATRCTFIENGSPSPTENCFSGGAMLSYGMLLRIHDCLFAGNQCLDSGGGLSTNALASISNSHFVGNTCSVTGSQGGAIELRGSEFPRVLTNCILWGNSAGSGPEIAIEGGLTSIAYCDLDGGQAAVFADASATVQWGAGLLALDPQFVDPDGADNDPLTFLDNVYRLRPTSPCIDAGDNFGLPPDALDLDGDGNTTEPLPLDLVLKPRRADVAGAPDVGNGTAPLVDMGAYERQF